MKIGMRLIFSLFIPVLALAKNPVWLISPNPLTPTSFNLSQNGAAIVEYTITNQSSRAHRLQMQPIPGVTQLFGPGLCASSQSLGPKNSAHASCNFLLLIDGSSLPPSGIHSTFGSSLPKFCQVVASGPSSICYGPNSEGSGLDVYLTTHSVLYAGAQNGNVYRSTNNGTTWATFISMPNPGQAISSLFATPNTIYVGAGSDSVYYLTNNGATWSSTSAPAPNQIVNSVFLSSRSNAESRLYVGSANGHVYYTTNGSTWTDLGVPDPSNGAVNSLFVIPPSTVYAGTINGYVVYTNNNGQPWTPINGPPDGSAVNSIFVSNNTLYANTANELTYTSASLTGGGQWDLYAQTVFTLFANGNGSTIDAGTKGGYVFSLVDGTELGFVAYTPINSVFALP